MCDVGIAASYYADVNCACRTGFFCGGCVWFLSPRCPMEGACQAEARHTSKVFAFSLPLSSPRSSLVSRLSWYIMSRMVAFVLLAVLASSALVSAEVDCSSIQNNLECYDQYTRNGPKIIQHCTWVSEVDSSIESICSSQNSKSDCEVADTNLQDEKWCNKTATNEGECDIARAGCEFVGSKCVARSFCRPSEAGDKTAYPMPSICSFSSKVGYFCSDGRSCCESMSLPRCGCLLSVTDTPTAAPSDSPTTATSPPSTTPPSAATTKAPAIDDDEEDDEASFLDDAVEWVKDNIAITAGAGGALVLLSALGCWLCCRRRGSKAKRKESMDDRRVKYKEAAEMFDQVSKRSLAGDELEKYLDDREKVSAPPPMSQGVPLSPRSTSSLHRLTGTGLGRQTPAASTDSQFSVELGTFLNPADRILAKPSNSSRSIQSSSSRRGNNHSPLSYAYPPGISQV